MVSRGRQTTIIGFSGKKCIWMANEIKLLKAFAGLQRCEMKSQVQCCMHVMHLCLSMLTYCSLTPNSASLVI